MDTDHRIVIVGAGFAGLGTAIRLRQAGIEDFVVLERGADVGGTWRANTYPGCQCDVPSHLYSLSFAPNPDWSRTFSRQPEIWGYLRATAERHGVMEHMRFGCAVTGASWVQERQRWRIETSQGALTAEVVISGMGGLSEPSIPDIPGLESFAGAAFHTAEWDHEQELDGKRVAVIGTGASAIQVVPSIQPRVGELRLFQRTPPWIMPHGDRPISLRERRVYRRFPLAQRAMREGIYWARELFVLPFLHPRVGVVGERIARRHLRRQVRDPRLRARLAPTYRMGCKRVLISNEYYPALQKENVRLVTEGIREIRPHGIVTEDGVEHEVDAIVFGTGFHVSDAPFAEFVRGRDGRSLAEVWQGTAQAHLGTAVAGFPNLFLLLGPNTALGHTSVVFMIECQIRYVMDCLRAMERRGLRAVEPRAGAQGAFIAEVRRRERGTVWVAGGCASWYLDANGANSTVWPGPTWRYRRRMRRFEAGEYHLYPRTLPASAAADSAKAPVAA
jgi:cation diffusion facilitator CzcD-associated flavoprotein CzcO